MMAMLKFLTGMIAVAVLGWAAFHFEGTPGSAVSAQRKLEMRVQQALGADAVTWAQAEIDGQKVIISGEAPDRSDRDAVIARIKTADWPGGFLLGGVTVIDQTNLRVSPTLTAEGVAQTPESLETTASAAKEQSPAPSGDVSASNTTGGNDSSVVATMTDTTPEDAVVTLIERAENQIAAAETNVETASQPPVAPPCDELLRASISANLVTFESARADINFAGRQQLREVAAAIVDCPGVSLRIIGHTDNSGATARNRELSDYRANAVRTFMISLGAPADRIVAIGVGATQPQASNDTASGRERNRRIDIEIINDEE